MNQARNNLPRPWPGRKAAVSGHSRLSPAAVRRHFEPDFWRSTAAVFRAHQIALDELLRRAADIRMGQDAGFLFEHGVAVVRIWQEALKRAESLERGEAA